MRKKLATTVILTGASIASIHTINSIHTSLCTVKKLLDNSENHYYDWRFGKIRYQKKGNENGSPILFIHDLTVGSSGYEYHRLINNLTNKFQIYTLDLLGYGLSDKPSMTYTNSLYEQLVNDFVKNVIGKRTSIIATGESVPFIILACHNNPELYNKIICINPQNLYLQNQAPSKETGFLKLLFETPILGTFIYNILINKHSIEKNFKEEYFFHVEQIKEKYILNYLEAAYTKGSHAKHAFASYTGKYMNINIIHELKEINNSILIIGGEKEKDIKLIIENYKYYNPSIEEIIIPNTKHLPQLEDPDAILEQINMFF